MKVIDLMTLNGTTRDVRFDGGMISIRPILARDGMGFSVHKTVIPRGSKYRWHYKNHLEVCYCVGGWGVLTELKSGRQHMIREDWCYALDQHDEHSFEALEDTVLISIFNPPCVGNERHAADGSYPVAEIANERV